jgi:predicted ester cyclase
MLSATAYSPYADPEEYIVEWTDKIWQSYGMGLIRDHYHPDIKLHGAYGHSGSRESVIEGCFVKKTAFPERAFTAEDVVWEERTDNSWVSSHRIINAGVQSGFWQYGPPSNRLSTSRNIALCLVRDAWIVEEWVVRDEWAVVEQNGLDVDAIARELALRPNATILGSRAEEGLFGPPPPDPLTEGDSGPRPDNQPNECRMVLDFIETAWNQRLLNVAPDFLHRSHVCYTSRYRAYCRAAGYQQALGELIATFPDARFDVRDVAANTDPFHGTRVSVMWNMRGTYAGAPTYGPLTYSPVAVLGISHFVFRDGRIHNEFRVYDELAVLTQIESARNKEPA